MGADRCFPVARAMCRWVCRWWFDLQGSGLERFEGLPGCVVACNHVSYLDPVVVGAVTRRPMWFLAKQELFQIPVFGPLLTTLHTIPLRQHGADVEAVRVAVRALRAGGAVLVFPEGGRSPDGTLQPGQPGVALLALRAGVPIVPVYVEGSYEALPRGGRWPRRHPIRVRFGAPLDPTTMAPPGPRAERYQAIAKGVMEAIGRVRDNVEWRS